MFRSIKALVRPTLFRFATETSKDAKAVVDKAKVKADTNRLTLYQNGQLISRTSVALKSQQDVESYVIKTVQNYFRTTYKDGVNINSVLADHGLDSLDQIEIAMQIQQDLGYLISAQTLPVLRDVKHFVNYINQVEAFKKENNKEPLA